MKNETEKNGTSILKYELYIFNQTFESNGAWKLQRILWLALKCWILIDSL